MSDSTDLSKQFVGQYAVITGGTQGMGEAVARLFAARGAAGLVVCGRNKAKGDEKRLQDTLCRGRPRQG